MGVGPEGRTGRAQLAHIRQSLLPELLQRGDATRDAPIVVVHCSQAPPSLLASLAGARVHLYEVPCAGNLHSSAIELLVRGAGSGVLIGTCPPRDCTGREGPKWLEERLYHDREAELKPRVDRRRVRTTTFAYGLDRAALHEVSRFRLEIAALDQAEGERDVDLVEACEPQPVGEPV
jgi:hypothetical protein